ncbi:MAG: hypothetical protein ACR2PM_16610 [Hyphomicrobiales bacterium]
MAQLKMSVDISEFDLTHVTVKMVVLDKRGRSTVDAAELNGGFLPSSGELRMTLPELHIFLRALLEFKGPIELTTPARDRKKAAALAAKEAAQAAKEEVGRHEMFLEDSAPLPHVDAAE